MYRTKKSELFDKRMIKIISLYKFLILDKLDYNLFFNITYLYKLIFLILLGSLGILIL